MLIKDNITYHLTWPTYNKILFLKYFIPRFCTTTTCIWRSFYKFTDWKTKLLQFLYGFINETKQWGGRTSRLYLGNVHPICILFLLYLFWVSEWVLWLATSRKKVMTETDLCFGSDWITELISSQLHDRESTVSYCIFLFASSFSLLLSVSNRQ